MCFIMNVLITLIRKFWHFVCLAFIDNNISNVSALRRINLPSRYYRNVKMMFLHQLYMLMWKNFQARKRNKRGVILLIIWPLFLFTILFWFRTKGLKTNIPECHFREKAMPSAGSFVFLQDLLCNFNNTCYNNYNDSLFNNNRFMLLFQNLQQMYNTSTPKLNILNGIRGQYVGIANVSNSITMADIMENDTSLQNLMQVQNAFTTNETKQQLLSTIISISNVTLQDVANFNKDAHAQLCNEATVDRLLISNYTGLTSFLCTLSNDDINIISDAIKRKFTSDDITSNSQDAIVTFRKIFQSNDTGSDENDNILSAIIKRYKQVNSILKQMSSINTTESENMFSLIARLLCGNEELNILRQLEELGGKVTDKMDSINDQNLNSNYHVDHKYEYDNSTTEYCNNIFKYLESHSLLFAFWRVIKPFIRGKILYTPLTNETSKIMNEVDGIFILMKNQLENLLNMSNSSLPLITKALDEDTAMLSLFKELLETSATQGKWFPKSIDIGIGIGVDAEELRFTDELMKNISVLMKNASASVENGYQLLQCFDFNKVVAFSNETEAFNHAMELVNTNSLWALVTFNGTSPLTTYSIRMNTDRVDDTTFTKDSWMRLGSRRRPTIDLKYITYGFAYLQDLIDRSIIKFHTAVSSDKIPGIILKQFPYPCYIDDEFIFAISRTFPLLMVLAWVYPCSTIVKSVVYEKEKRLKEMMRLMGLSNLVHWLGWTIDSILLMIFTAFLLSSILVFGKVIERAAFSLVFVFLCIYCASVVAQSFLISVFFSKANLASVCASVIFFVLYLPYPFVVRWVLLLPTYLKIFLCFSPNVAFGIGASYLAYFEEGGVGARWDNFRQSPIYGDEFSLAIVFTLIVFDTFAFLLFTWYLEAVFPGEIGIARPYYFPFMKSYWFGHSKSKLQQFSNSSFTPAHTVQNDCVESEPITLKKGVSLNNLCKTFENGKTAVKNLSMNFFQNQITAFLGHNGAGKTTTIYMLTGMFPPTSGTAMIYGLDVTTDMDAIRQQLGFCPQYDVLFHSLTVFEHLWFYGSLRTRGKNQSKLKDEVNQMIVDIELSDKYHSFPSQLSGGMKRKLCVAIAFIGGSRTVILDEPTSGVDPYSRRAIWELLIRFKAGRTVMLTTHFMDEADLLGDRIAIIAAGSLRCCGSATYLKCKYGAGYYLTIEFLKLEEEGGEVIQSTTWMDQRLTELTILIEGIVPFSELVQREGLEVKYALPDRYNVSAFQQLFTAIDSKQKQLYILSYGICDTNLEEIFLKVAMEASEEEGEGAGKGEESHIIDNEMINESLPTLPPVERIQIESRLDPSASDAWAPLIRRSVFFRSMKYRSKTLGSLSKSDKSYGATWWSQLIAIQVRLFRRTVRNKKSIFSEMVTPALFVALLFAITSILPPMGERPPLDLNIWIYGHPSKLFIQKNNDSIFTKELLGNIGYGTACIDKPNATKMEWCEKENEGKFHWSNVSSSTTPVEWHVAGTCSCSSGNQICSNGAEGPKPPLVHVATGDVVYDMTGRNASDWIVKTWNEFTLSRVGGFTFGLSEGQGRSLKSISDVESFIRGTKEMNDNNETVDGGTSNIKIWYNNKDWAASVSLMNAVNNVVLRSLLPENVSSLKSHYGIVTINHPMNFTKKQFNSEVLKLSAYSLLYAVGIIFAVSFVPASFLLYIIDDRQSNCKHLQIISGLSKLYYWLFIHLWNLLCYGISCALCVAVFIIFDEQAYISKHNFPGLVLLLALFGWSVMPLMYLLSHLFTIPSTAFVTLGCANMFVGIITTITMFVLQSLDYQDLQNAKEILQQLFPLIPHFCFGEGLMKLATNYYVSQAFYNLDIKVEYDILSWDILGRNLVFMSITGLVLFIANILYEYKLFHYIFTKGQNVIITPIENLLDDDVLAEKARVLAVGNKMDSVQQDVLLLKQLTKVYKNNYGDKLVAVNDVSLGVQQGECFGLLGLNGAGKTTIFKILTGDMMATSGDVYICGYSVKNEMNHIRRLIGYCPQYDALDPLLTPKEHLYFFARLRNIPKHSVHLLVSETLKEFGLCEYINRVSGTLSGGNKRKLSAAIAMLGKPPLIFLDEPTSGMDPKSRRFLWTRIKGAIGEGQCIILTSHSMEECEQLCTRVTIMVNGTFRCLGSPQHLKSKYGEGYSLVIRTNVDNMNKLNKFINTELPESKLVETHYNQLRYRLSLTNTKLATIFKLMEYAKKEQFLNDYSVSQTTLEEVFIKFAIEQNEQLQPNASAYSYFKSMFNSCCPFCSAKNE